MKTINSIALVAALAVSTVTAGTAHAGGLFGNGGLIRGSVGNFLDKNLEKPILTPAARAGTIAAGTALGASAGGLAGVPQIGGAMGGQLGHGINNAARGSNFNAPRRLQPVRPQVPQQNFRMAQQMGNFCHTPYGRFGPGPFMPVGSPCHTFINGSQVMGNVSW